MFHRSDIYFTGSSVLYFFVIYLISVQMSYMLLIVN